MMRIIKKDGTELTNVEPVCVPQEGEDIWFGTSVEDSERFSVSGRVIEIVNGKMEITIIVE